VKKAKCEVRSVGYTLADSVRTGSALAGVPSPEGFQQRRQLADKPAAINDRRGHGAAVSLIVIHPSVSGEATGLIFTITPRLKEFFSFFKSMISLNPREGIHLWPGYCFLQGPIWVRRRLADET